MTALYIALGIAVVLLLLAWTPVGVRLAFQGALSLQVRIGPLRITVVPSKEKKPAKGKKKKQAEAKSAKAEAGKKPRRPNRRQILYALDTLPPILKRALGGFGRGLRVPELRVHVVFGGEDPADTALLYGKTQAAVGMALPALEQLVAVGETDVALATDYQAERTEFSVDITVQIRLGALAVLGGGVLKDMAAWLRGYRALADRAEDTKTGPADAAGAA